MPKHSLRDYLWIIAVNAGFVLVVVGITILCIATWHIVSDFTYSPGASTSLNDVNTPYTLSIFSPEDT